MTDYYELAELADRVFTIAEDNPERLVGVLETLDPALCDELLGSDFLNAFQVFYWYFREHPTELGEERLILEPAGAVSRGVLVEEIDLFELVFLVVGRAPVVRVTDGEQILREFIGPSAYRSAFRFAEGSA